MSTHTTWSALAVPPATPATYVHRPVLAPRPEERSACCDATITISIDGEIAMCRACCEEV
jgi:hypothetical protein